MNKADITLLVIHLRETAKYAEAAGFALCARFCRDMATEIENKYSEHFVA